MPTHTTPRANASLKLTPSTDILPRYTARQQRAARRDRGRLELALRAAERGGVGAGRLGDDRALRAREPRRPDRRARAPAARPPRAPTLSPSAQPRTSARVRRVVLPHAHDAAQQRVARQEDEHAARHALGERADRGAEAVEQEAVVLQVAERARQALKRLVTVEVARARRREQLRAPTTCGACSGGGRRGRRAANARPELVLQRVERARACRS